MDRNYLVRLVLAVYRVTDIFPNNENLKLKIRKSANEILADLILVSTNNLVLGLKEKKSIHSRIIEEIRRLKHYLSESKENELANPINFLVLIREYDRIEKYFTEDKYSKTEKSSNLISLTPRRKKILDILKKEEKVQVGSLQKKLQGVSKRTLRRDLDYLCSNGLAERVGKWNEIFYQLIE